MADYIINVGVEVEDSALNALETRINSLKEKHIKLGVELGNTKQLTKNAQTAVKTISKATAKAAKSTPIINLGFKHRLTKLFFEIEGDVNTDLIL